MNALNIVAATLSAAVLLSGGPGLAHAADSRMPLAKGRCPERVQIGFGETAADIARRCGVTPEALDRFNPGLGRDGGRTGMTVTVPQPALPSPASGAIRNGFVPVPTPPGALGR